MTATAGGIRPIVAGDQLSKLGDESAEILWGGECHFAVECEGCQSLLGIGGGAHQEANIVDGPCRSGCQPFGRVSVTGVADVPAGGKQFGIDEDAVCGCDEESLREPTPRLLANQPDEPMVLEFAEVVVDLLPSQPESPSQAAGRPRLLEPLEEFPPQR